MNSKHTPGPWISNGLRITQSESGALLAQVRMPLGNEKLAIEKAESNAALIASAPDLLAALRDLDYAVSGNHALQGLPFFQQARDAARVAIAKAEGRQ